MSEQRAVTILFADIAGSTKLFELRGDVEARALTSQVLGALSAITMRNQGRVIKTIGDEIMCVFPAPVNALQASVEMQRRVAGDANWARDYLAIRIGLHHGEALLEDGDVYGDAVNTAARMGQLSKREQIVTTSSTVEGLLSNGSFRIRSLGEALVKGKISAVDIVDVLWQEDTSNVTMVAKAIRLDQLGVTQKLVLRVRGELVELGDSSPSFGMGRDPANGCIVDNEWVSRNHALIEFQRGQFLITDRSTNGTFVKIGSDDEIRLHRDSMPLRKSGSISLGQAQDKDPASVVYFQCSHL
jgi:adenylate cyclase